MAFGLHTSPVVVVATIWLGCISLSCSLPLCDSDRPNSWATHRTLTLPQHIITGTAVEDAWSKALCCVYTHVEAGDVSEPVLTTYDGSRYKIIFSQGRL